MNVGNVMDEVAARLGAISGLRVFSYPTDSLTPPAAVVVYPDETTFDATYGRGMDRMTLPVIVFLGKASARSTRDQLTAYADGSGERSVKAAIEGPGPGESYDYARVTGYEVDILIVGGSEYLAATFELDIAGAGSG
jgi:hypothetical protein